MKRACQFLQKTTRAWINRLVTEYEFDERHIRILNLAGECWDRLDAIREVLKVEGYMLKDRFEQSRPHPLLAEERAQKKLFIQLIRELGLDLEELEIPRTPSI